jgi:hypothetical protein
MECEPFVLGGNGGNFVGGKSQRISEKIMEKKNSWRRLLEKTRMEVKAVHSVPY